VIIESMLETRNEKIIGHYNILLSLIPQMMELDFPPKNYWNFFNKIEEDSNAPFF